MLEELYTEEKKQLQELEEKLKVWICVHIYIMACMHECTSVQKYSYHHVLHLCSLKLHVYAYL